MSYVAYCAPGRKFITSLNLFFREENVSEIHESEALDGNEVLLVNRHE